MEDPQRISASYSKEHRGGQDIVPAGGNHPVRRPHPEESSDFESKGPLQVAIVMTTLCLCVFMAAIDQTIVATALPVISEHFESAAVYTWVGSVYLLAMSASAVLWGKISDIWGRKPILLLAVGTFFVGSLLCALSVSAAMIIASRAVQGVGGGGITTLVNICISDLFSMRNRPKYFGFVGMIWALSASIGPVLGGAFTEKVSWRWCFYINLPIIGLAFAALTFLLELHSPRTPLLLGLVAVDWSGCILSVGGTVMFLIGLGLGGVSFSWSSPTVVCLIVLGIMLLGAFLYVEARVSKNPILPMRIFKHRSNIASLGVCYVHGFVFISVAYYMPLYFQAILGASPLLSGAYILSFSVALSFASLLTGAIISATGRYLELIRVGIVFMTLGVGLLLDLPDHASWPKIIVYLIIAGLGSGPNFQAPLVALQSMVAPRDIAMATATFVFVRSIASSTSIVLGGVIFQNGMKQRLPQLRDEIGPQMASLFSGTSAAANVRQLMALPLTARLIVRHVYWASLRNVWILFTSISVMGVALSFFIIKKELDRKHAVVEIGLQESSRQEGPAKHDV